VEKKPDIETLNIAAITMGGREAKGRTKVSREPRQWGQRKHSQIKGFERGKGGSWGKNQGIKDPKPGGGGERG